MSGPSDPGFSGDDESLTPRLIDALAKIATQLTGFSREAIQPEALRRSARELLALWPIEELFSRIHMRDAQVTHALRSAVSVGETFFFRQPEHFRFIQETLAPEWLARRVPQVRAWSAGCATGEEPYSIAACLQSALVGAPQIGIDVLGTDLLPRNLAVAKAATYGAWSQRPSAPMLAPLLHALEGPPGVPPLVRVLDSVRALVRFREQNLLELSPEAEPFDVIFCRNVLVYFEPDAARRAIANLAHALAPGGVLMLGSMDLNVAPPDLLREGKTESLIFRKRSGREPAHATSPGPERSSAPGAARSDSPGAGELATPLARAPETDLRSANPGLARSSNPGLASSSNPGLARGSNPGLARSSNPGLARSSSPGLAAAQLGITERIPAHLRALLQIERGDLEAAEKTLRALIAGAPDYLPGMFERALLHSRRGEPAAATALMREVHRRASALAPGETVDGPERLEGSFYVESAEAYLRGGRG